MPFAKERHAEPIPGYRLLERLGRGGFGEVWKCEAPGGLFKAIKFVYGEPGGLAGGAGQADEERQAIERIKDIRHPFLLSMDRVEDVGGELVIVTELADKSLLDLLREYRQAGLPGVPRAELLAYLAETAEVLDLLNVQHGLQHLDVKPHNLFLVSGHVKVADFGLVSRLGAGPGRGGVTPPLPGSITPLYAAPEVFLGRISGQSDQYSLAVAYQELLTGGLPFRGKSARQLLLLHTQAQPDLGLLPEADRPVVARALAKDPQDRFPTCLDFVRALSLKDEGGRMKDEPERGLSGSSFILPPSSLAEVDTDRSLSVTPSPAAAATTRQAVPAVRALADYSFLECLGCSPLMDAWRVQVPGGGQRLVKLVYGAAPDPGRLGEALVRFKLLLHRALAPAEVVQADPGRLVLLTDLPGETVRDRFGPGRGEVTSPLAGRQPDLPRDELLGYLRAAAEALDYLYQQHSVQHLGLNPRNLLLGRGRLVIEEFGLAQLFWLPAGQPVAQRNVRYAPPELFAGTAARNGDQFSLAVIYCELLTGCHPFAGRAAEAGATPDLGRLPEGDRDVIARALSPDPLKRWPSCTDLVRALAGDGPGACGPQDGDGFSQRLREAASQGRVPMERSALCTPHSGSQLGEIIAQLLASAGGRGEVPSPGPAEAEGAPALSAAEGVLRHRFSAGVPLGTAHLKLDALRQQWYGQPVHEDEHSYAFHVSLPTSFWQQWIGRQPGLEVQVGLARQHALAATPIDVTVQVRAFRCSQKRGTELLEDVGLSLLESLRTALLAGAEKRVQERLLWPYPLRVRPALAEGGLGEAVLCRGKDISLSGIGFYLPHELPTPDVSVELPATGSLPAVAVPATLVRAKRCADGWYEVGALFRLAALRKSLPELCLS
jgi:serine/threonine protein kinase